jgi:hypothetical protein
MSKKNGPLHTISKWLQGGEREMITLSKGKDEEDSRVLTMLTTSNLDKGIIIRFIAY